MNRLPSRVRMACLGILLWVCSSGALAAPDSTAVLGPDVGPRLGEVLARTMSPWQVRSIAVDAARARLTVCPPSGLPEACARVVLDATGGTCEGLILGAWCLQGFGALPPDTWVGLVGVLAAGPGVPEPRDPDGAPGRDWRESINDLPPPLLLTLWFLVPLSIGASAGLALRRAVSSACIRMWMTCGLAGLLAVSAAVAWSVSGDALAPGAWDQSGFVALLVGGLWATGNARRGWDRRRRLQWMVLALFFLASLVGAEVAVRALRVGVPMVGDVSVKWFFGLRESVPSRHLCDRLFGSDLIDAWHRPLLEAPAGMPLVVHLGDSMVEGNGVASCDAFPAVLDRQEPHVRHINAGLSGGVGPDGYYFRLRQILASRRPDRIVLYLNPQNDLEDLDKVLHCCAHGLLFHPNVEGRPIPRCERADWRMGVAERLLASPSPLPLRIVQRRSVLARAILVQWNRLSEWWSGHFGNGVAPPDPWSRFTQMVRAIRDDLGPLGVELHVVILPDRFAFDRADRFRIAAENGVALRMEAVARDLGLATYRAWDDFQARASREGTQTDFLGPPDSGRGADSHFSERGHREMAGWVRQHLPPLAVR